MENAITPFLQLQDLHYRIGNHPLISGVSAEIPAGVALVQGGDGRGKTSLLQLIAGEKSPDGGRLILNGADLHSERARYVKQVYWVAPQSADFDALTGIAFLQQMRQRFSAFDPEQAETLIDTLALTEHIEKPLYMLSTGSRRKVGLCAAFSCGAPLTLLDMPFAALDKVSIQTVTALLAEQAQQRQRIWIISDYTAPAGVDLSRCIDLGD